MRQLLVELFYINDRISCGDIVSPKAAMPRVEKILSHYKDMFEDQGCSGVKLQAYQAAGGWIGLTYEWTVKGETKPVMGSLTPRRHTF